MHFFLLAGFLLDGLATAAEQIVGRSIGAKYPNGFVRGVKLTLLWSTGLSAICTLIFWFAGHYLIDVLTTAEDVRVAAYSYLAWAALVPLTGMLAFNMDGVFIGATWSRDMSIMMIISLAGYLIVWQLVKTPLGNHGLWLALHAFVIFRGLTLVARLPVRYRQTFGAASA